MSDTLKSSLTTAVPGPGTAEPTPPSDTCTLSIVVPAYNEELRIAPTLEAIDAYLESKRIDGEIVVVDDGSRDGTSVVVSKMMLRMKRLRLITNRVNRGKGFAVRTGMLQSCGRVILFSDADLSTPIEELQKLWKRLDAGFDVAIASRYLAKSNIIVQQPLTRRYLGRIWILVIALLGIRGFADTQCGFKMFTRASARRIFARLKTDGFSFDVEALMLARRFGCKIAEVPIRWLDSPSSHIRPIRDSAAMLVECLRARRFF
jgi:dolichyl-phosphate beta-glucosyltransferase